jgi:CheY-like chemotaxis protein
MARARVLLIDDNVAFAENIQEILADEGVAVTIAADGPTGLSCLDREPCDLVITDMRMPGMNGLQVIRFIKERWPALPVAVMSAYARDELLEQAERAGALGIFSKPVDMDHLARLVRRVTAGAERVLVVEDDDDMRTSLVALVQEGSEATPLPAATAAEALRVAAQVAVDAAIVDLGLPDMDGIDLGRRLREAVREDLPVILITGHAPDFRSSLTEVLRLPGVHLIEKPFPPDRLLSLLRRPART